MKTLYIVPLRLILLALLPVAANAQILHFQDPLVDHPIYSYLERMQTAGRMPLLSSTRPYLGHVCHPIVMNADALNAEDRRYLAESTAQMTAIGQLTVVEGESGWTKLRRKAGLHDRQWPWLYRDGFHITSWNYDTTFSVAIQPVYGLEVIDTEYDTNYDDESSINNSNWVARANTISRFTSGLRIEGGYARRLRFLMDFRDHTESGNGPYTSRSQLYEDKWATVDLKGGNSISYDISESFLQYYGRNLSITAGRGRNYWGPSRHGSLFLNSQMPPFDYVRWDAVLENQKRQAIYYTFLHGWLESQLPTDTLYVTPGGRPRTLNQQKYLSAQRLEIRPRDNLLFGLSQAVVYGNRDVHISYLTPLNFLYSVQHSNDDKDNFLLSFDANWRPVNGVRVYGEALFDDIVVSALTTSSGSNKSAFTAGAHLAGTSGWLKHLDGGVEYTKIRPFVYSHVFDVNTYTHWTSPLGYTLEPNSAIMTYDLRATFYPVQVELSYQWRHHGANTEEKNVGGDIYAPLEDTAKDNLYRFVDGHKMHYETMSGMVTWEVLPGLRATAGVTSIVEPDLWDRMEIRGGFGWNL